MATLETQERAVSALVDAGTETGRARGFGSHVASGLLSVLLVGLVALVAAVTVVPRAMGAVPLTVLTGSMEPAISPGDLVVVRPTPADEIRVGDVITFQPVSGEPTLVTHRVTGLTLGASGAVSGFTTQGDANSAADDPIVVDQVQGRVVYSVPWIGHVTSAGLSSQVAAVAGVGLLGYGLGTVLIAYRKDKTKDEEERP